MGNSKQKAERRTEIRMGEHLHGLMHIVNLNSEMKPRFVAILDMTRTVSVALHRPVVHTPIGYYLVTACAALHCTSCAWPITCIGVKHSNMLIVEGV